VKTRLQIRPAQRTDLESIAAIQATAPEASQWPPADYLVYETRVALAGEQIVGFATYRTVGPGEHEILNLAVSPAWRRRGVARALVGSLRTAAPGVWFLEVRESNRAARRLYEAMDFTEAGVRLAYYENPSESGIVMRFYS